VWLSFGQALPNFNHKRGIQDLLNALAVEIAQHIGVACTTSFDVATWIDVQSAPWRCTVKVTHEVFTGFAELDSVLAANEQTKVWFALHHTGEQTNQNCD
jgi:hypothetical protein